MSDDESLGSKVVSKLIDAGLTAVTKLIGGLFGKSPTKKKLEAINEQANYAAALDQKNKSTLTGIIVLAGVLVLVVLFLIIRRRK